MKRNRIIFILTICLLVFMAFALISCGGSNNKPNKDGGDTGPKNFTVQFINDGVVFKSEDYTVGTTSITYPTIPQVEGYSSQWETVDISKAKKGDVIKINVVYTPLQYTAKFYINGSNTAFREMSFDVENPLKKSELPEYNKDGEVFYGWYLDRNFSVNKDKITSDIDVNNKKIEDRVINIYGGTYEGSAGFSLEYVYDVVNPKYRINAYDENRINEVVFPETFNGIGVEGVLCGTGTGAKNFRNHTEITSVTIPSTYDYLQTSMFYGCENIKYMSLPFICLDITDKNYGMDASWLGARSTENLEEIVIDRGIVRNAEFWKSEKLKKITLNNVGLDENAFTNSDIEDVTLLANIDIPKSAFSGCDKLAKINFDKMLNIGEKAFAGCRSLTKVTITSNTNLVQKEAFKGCINLEEFNIGAKTIGENIIGNCNIKKVKLLEGVLTIDEKAFFDNVNLEEIEFSSTVKTIGISAFSGTNIETLDLTPTNIETIDESAFENCTNLRFVKLPAVEAINIERYAFNNCVNLREIWNLSNLTIMPGYHSYGELAFYVVNIYDDIDAQSTLNIVENDNITFEYVIDSSDNYWLTRYENTQITNTIEFPANINGHSYSLANGPIIGTDLTEKDNLTLVLSQNTLNIGDRNFYNLPQIVGINNYEQLKRIGEYAFFNTNIATNLDLSNIEYIGEYAFYGNKFESISLSNKLTRIEIFTFYDCSNLTSVNLQEGIKTIGASAFSNTKLESIIIPSTVETIYNDAFNVNTLEEITLSENSKLLNANRGFSGTYGDVVINISDWDDWARINFAPENDSIICESNIINNSNSVTFKVNGVASNDIVLNDANLLVGSYNLYGLKTNLNSLTIESNITDVFFKTGSFSFANGIKIQTLYVKDFDGLVSLSLEEDNYFYGPVNKSNKILAYNEDSENYDIEILNSGVLIISNVESIGSFAFAGVVATNYYISNINTINTGAFKHSESGTSVNLSNIDLVDFSAFGNGQVEISATSVDEYTVISVVNGRQITTGTISSWLQCGHKLIKK